MAPPWAYEDVVAVPGAVRFPVELEPPDGFDPERLETWPRLDGRLEFTDERLLYMPPCGDAQQYTITDVVIVLGAWVRAHRDFVLGSNEAGMRLKGATRAADAAIWRRSEAGPIMGGLQRTAPLLAVEVAGRYDSEAMLRDKARWYLSAGVATVWLVLPETREVVVIDGARELRCAQGQRVPAPARLDGLAPAVDDFFVQISGG